MCHIIRADGLPLQRAVRSYCGCSAGLYWHPTKLSGSQDICWQTSSSHSDPWGHIGTHIYTNRDTKILLSMCARTCFFRTHTHIPRHTHKSLAPNGCNWPLGSLPAACWVCPVGAPVLVASSTVGCLGDAVLETIRLGVVWRPWRPCPLDRPQRQKVSQAQMYELRHGWLWWNICHSRSHGLNVKGPEKWF